jgi:hypothetical protein
MKKLLIGLIFASAGLVGFGVWLMESVTTAGSALLGAVIAVVGLANAIVNGWNLWCDWRWL